MTLPQFLAWEERQEGRYEFDGFRPVARAGGTAHDDLVVKNAEYRATPSIARYVILQQVRAGAIVFTRKGEDWVTEIVGGDGVLRMPEIGVEIPLTEIYADVGTTAGQEETPGRG